MPKRLFDEPLIARTHRLREDQLSEVEELAEEEGINVADEMRSVVDLGITEKRRQLRRRRAEDGAA
jgi:hypothetical protein